MQMIVAQNLPAPLAYATRPDVESDVTAVALGEEDRFLEDGHDEKTTARTSFVYTESRMS